MARQVLLTLALVAAMFISPSAAVAANLPNCTQIQLRHGQCPGATATSTADEVKLAARLKSQGGGEAVDTRRRSSTGTLFFEGIDVDLALRSGVGEAWLENGVSATGPATLADIASFRPTPGVAAMEPDGWMVVGLDTNFYASAGTHQVSGILLGQPADVRFTPVGYRWDYGDGTTKTLTAKGGPWKALGVGEFDPTPTSHSYQRAGTYTIQMSVLYAAEYQYATSDWFVVRGGALAIPANQLTATAGRAETVLVARDCHANPAGPGCSR